MKMRFLPVSLLLTALLVAPAVALDTYVIDPAHSTVAFSVRHMVITNVNGAFADFSGTITYDPDNISASSVEVTIKTSSIDTRNQKRDDHLRTSDFLDAENHPEITFKSRKVTKSDDGFTAVGDLTIRGVTKEVSLDFVVNGPVQNPWGQTVMGVEIEPITINRQEFGVEWNKAMDNGGVVVGDDVTIQLSVEAQKQS